MQRWCSKLRSFSQIYTSSKTPNFSPSFGRFFNTASNLHCSSSSSAISSQFKHQLYAPSSTSTLPRDGVCSSSLGFRFVQMRNFSAKSKEKKWKKLTPATSKVKKIKMKTISAFKGRFRTLNDGTIRRWREGKRHNAHLKSKKSKRRLRKPAIVPAAYAKVMKKMNFCANY
ncbi:hypothetical protein RND81_06G213000 [Saponaria officinalis]|uniref:50S ribosomal protein L35 n=1 Tax=Saponaria officinalis TaxID=3572 RepID=A0AAW1K921_SAPOF